jgi:hypothetical protein
MIEYRKMTVDDIEAGLALCRSAGWNQLSNDWKIFLELDPDGNRVAIDSNKVVRNSNYGHLRRSLQLDWYGTG